MLIGIYDRSQVSVYRTIVPLYIFYIIYISTDINECATGTPCNSGSCSNTPGTFTCDCTGTGFEGPTCSSGKAHKVTRA